MTRNRWYNYLIGGVLGLLLTLSITKVLWPLISKLLNNGSDILYFTAVNLTFFPIIISIAAVVFIYHKFRLKNIKFKRIAWGFFIWFILQIISLLYSYIFENESIIFNYNPNKFFIFLGLSLLLTPIQVASEEFIFRGYLLNGLKSIKKGMIFPLLVSAFLFSILHLANPEVNDEKVLFFLIYLTMALLLGYLTLKYTGLEYALGIHFANNFFAINFLNYPNSPLPSSPLFILNGSVAPLPSLIQIITFSVMITIIIKKIEDYNIQIEKK